MKKIQITIDEALLSEIDRATMELKTTRSEFIRSAVESSLRLRAVQKKEDRHAQGYRVHPLRPGESDVWESEQAWGRE